MQRSVFVRQIVLRSSGSDDYESYKRMAEFSASDYPSNGFTALLISRYYSGLS